MLLMTIMMLARMIMMLAMVTRKVIRNESLARRGECKGPTLRYVDGTANYYYLLSLPKKRKT